MFTQLSKFYVFLVLTLLNYVSFAQTPGIIVRPAGGGTVTLLNPNGNAWASTSTSGFLSNDLAESEIAYKIVPATFTEPTGDLQRGPVGGFTEIVKNFDGSGFYTFFDGTNLFFRIRVGGLVSGSKGYSALIDADGTFGNTGPNADNNYVANTNGSNGNPGFEWEVVLETGKSVKVYNIDGTSSPVQVASYSLTTHSQVSVAITTDSQNPDYFYDFYVPISAFTGLKAITSSTPLRMIATTVMSPQAAIGGPISDIFGIGSFTDINTAFTSIINNQPSFTPANAASGGSGIASVLTAAPAITVPISTGTVTVAGTWTRLDATKGNTSTITLYKNGVSIGTTTATSGVGWSFANISTVTGDILYATAQASGESISPQSNIYKIIGCLAANTTATTSLTFACASDRGFEGTMAAGTTVKLYLVTSTGTTLVGDNSTTTYPIVYPTTTTWWYNGMNSQSGKTACTGGAADITAGQYAITTTASGQCPSAMVYTGGATTGYATTATPTITQGNVYEGNTVISGTAPSGATVSYFRNGNFVSSQVASGTAYSFTSLTLYNNDVIEIRAQSSGAAISSAVSKTVGLLTNPPVITIPLGGSLVAGASFISGTSPEPAGTLISMYENNTLKGTTTVQANGTWTYSIPVVANNNYYATAQRSGGSVSDPSATVLAKAATLSTMVPTITGTYRDDSLAVRGTLPASFTGKVFLYIDGQKVDSSALISNGTNWSISVTSSVNYRLYAGAVLTATAQSINTGVTPNVYSAENSITSNAVTVSGILPTKPVVSPGVSNIYKGQTVTYQVSNAQSGMLFSVRDATDATNLATSAFGTGSNLSLTTTAFSSVGTYNLRIKSTSITSSGVSTDSVVTVNVANLPARLYVNQANATSGDGTSWANAFKTVSEALNVAANYTSSTEIWVATGTYKPVYDITGLAVPSDARAATFSIPSGVNVYGGFAGTETILTQRNAQNNITVLSGDLGTINNTSDNAYHVVTLNNATAATIIDGFTITGGNANGAGNDTKGAGIYNIRGGTNVTFNNLIITANAASNGAGMYNDGSGTSNASSPVVSSVTFTNNTASISGGALYNDGSSSGASSPTISNAIVANNSAGSGGGFFSAGTGTRTITNSVFTGNAATSTSLNGGGAIALNGGTTNIISTTFFSNTTASTTNTNANTLSITAGGTVNLTNTIVYGAASNHIGNAGTITYTNSDVKGVAASGTNISADPYFVNEADVDGADNIFRTTDDGLVIRCASPASGRGTATGTPVTDIKGTTRAVPPSMGAYEAAAAVGIEWSGRVSNDWNDAANWCGGIPTSPTSVQVPAGATVVVTNANAFATNVTIAAGGSLVMNGSGNLVISAGGTFSNSGSFEASASTTGKVSFAGAGTISGTTSFKNIETSGALNFGTASTITGEFIIQAGGSVAVNSPTYACPGSTLTYNAGSIYTRGLEWTSANSGAGYPSNVRVQNNTTLNFPVVGPGYVCNDLIIDGGSAVNQNYSGGSAPLTVARDVTITGTLSLGALNGGDVNLGRNWTRNSGGVFTHNNRTVNFIGSYASSIVAPILTSSRDANGAFGGETFYKLGINKTNAADVVSLAAHISVLKELKLLKGTFDLANSDVTIVSKDENTAAVSSIPTSGGTISGVTINYSGTGKFVVQRHLPMAASSVARRWRMLTTPLQSTGAQTINQAWQQGVSNADRTAPVDPWPGFGTTITKSPIYNAGDGYDQGITSNPSIYYPTNATGNITWGVLPSLHIPITNYEGYMLFARGNRNIVVSTQYINANSTILEPKGRINTGDVQKAIKSGSQLIGNPYASSINFGTVTFANYTSGGTVFNATPNVAAGAGLTYYLWDPKTSGNFNVGKWITCSSNGDGTFAVTGNTSGLPTNGIIESGSAFMIASDVESGTLTFHENDKSTTSSSVGIASRETGLNNTIASLATTLLVRSGSTAAIADGVISSYHANFHNQVDGQDALSIANFNTADGLSIASRGKNLAVERRNDINPNDTIFLHLQNVSKKAYVFQFNPTNLLTALTATLEDKYLKLATPISLTDTSSIVFNINDDSASAASDRFRIVFKPAGVLPITFSSIRAISQQGKNLVQWKVENQEGIVKYAIERSGNGRDFVPVNVTMANHNLQQALYNWNDEKTLQGENYYRIKSISQSGEIAYSKVVKAVSQGLQSSVLVYPNPVRDQLIMLRFNNMEIGSYSLNIFNSIGQIVYHQKLQHDGVNNNFQIKPAKRLANGRYTVEVKHLSGTSKTTGVLMQ